MQSFPKDDPSKMTVLMAFTPTLGQRFHPRVRILLDGHQTDWWALSDWIRTSVLTKIPAGERPVITIG